MKLNIVADKDAIRKLKEVSGLKTNQDLINNALSLFTWAIKQKRKGYIVGSINESKDEMSYTEIIMPSLENVKEV